MVVFLWCIFFSWWCCGVFVVVSLRMCFCDGVVVFLWRCGGVLVVFLWWCGGVFVVVFLWWSFCGVVFAVVWWCFCGGVVVFFAVVFL